MQDMEYYLPINSEVSVLMRRMDFAFLGSYDPVFELFKILSCNSARGERSMFAL